MFAFIKTWILVIYVLLSDLIVVIFSGAWDLIFNSLSWFYKLHYIHSFIWWFYMLFRRGTIIYNKSASYELEDIKAVKKFIKDFEREIELGTFTYDYFKIRLSNDNTFWIANKWYSNDLLIDGREIIPRKSEQNELISLYYKSKKQ